MKHLKVLSLILLTTLTLTSCDFLSSGSNTSSSSNTNVDGSITIDIFANGDQHGVVESNTSYASYPTYVSYIKEQMNKCDYPILISNGDLWQGTYESNINYGKLLTECLDDVSYSCMTLGNHEFDWGQDVIRENTELTDVPFLGANIVDYQTKTLMDYVEPYTIVDVGPVNVGIIGCIGPDQWSSITSNYVLDIEFLDPVDVIKEYSDELRTEKDCDIVIASFHAGTDDASNWIYELGYTSSVSGLPYIDAAFTSHDHYYTTGKTNGVVYANSGSKNAKLSHISLTYQDGKVISSKAENLDTSASSLKNYSEDSKIRAVIDSYIDEDAKNKANEVEGSLSSSFGRYCDNTDNYGPRLAAKAMYEYTASEGYDVCAAFVNDARALLPSGNVTYSDILEAFPFFNNTIIMEV
ncbi:MAG: hypothetical protein LUD22_03845, partial [Coprobacillus sp.]|nr:hypothetical protein [Coprobacillus sp.]